MRACIWAFKGFTTETRLVSRTLRMHLSTHESERNLVNSQNTWLLFRRILEFRWQWGNSYRFLVELVDYYRFVLACTRWKVVHLCSHNIIQNTARHGHKPRSQMLSLTFTTSCASGLQKGGNRIDLFFVEAQRGSRARW